MCQIFGIGVRTIPNLERYRHKCQIKIMIFYSTFLSPLTSLFDFFLSLLTICLSPVFFLCFIPLQIRFPAFPSTSTSTSNVFLSLCTSNQTQINVFLLSLSSGRDMDWVVIDWLVFGELMVEFWVWVVELVVISVLGGSSGVWIFVGFGGGLRCQWVRPNPDRNHIVVWSYVVLHCYCPRSRRLVLHNSLPTSLNQVVGVRFGMVLWIWDLGWCRWVWDFWLWAVVWCCRFGGNFS